MPKPKEHGTKVIAVRIEYDLYERVKFLAMKRKESLNDWQKRIIKAAAQWKD